MTDRDHRRAYLTAAMKHPGGTVADTSWVEAAKRAARRADLANIVENDRWFLNRVFVYCARNRVK